MNITKFFALGFLAATGMYFLSIFIKGKMCELSDRIDGKTVLITGANSGIGLETAIELAHRGGIIHLACRNSKRCENAKKIILSRSHAAKGKIFLHNLDLASFASILSFTKQFKTSVEKLDILINNAGIMMGPYMQTEDGFEMQVGVNYLGHFLLTHELLDLIRQTKGARILIISSIVHVLASVKNGDLNSTLENYSPFKAYALSKLANILHAKQLSKMLEKDGVTVVSIHPGVIRTDLLRHLPLIEYVEKYTGLLLNIFLRSPLGGAQTTICCAVDPNLYKYSGEYFNDCAPVIPYNSEANDEEVIAQLWQRTMEMVYSKLNEIQFEQHYKIIPIT